MNIGLSLSDESTLITSLGRAQLGYGIYFGGFLVLLVLQFVHLFRRSRPRVFLLPGTSVPTAWASGSTMG